MEEEKQSLKETRSVKKGLVTRFSNSIKRFVAEEKEGEVKAQLEKLMTAFDEFEVIHTRYQDLLDEANWEESDAYFFEVQDSYIAALNSTKTWLRSRSQDVKDGIQDAAPVVKPEVTPSNTDLFTIMALPKVELEVFDGDPMQYHGFMTTFDEVVDRMVKDDRMKLTRLIQYTSGAAREAIRCCILIEGGQGYKQARDILYKRFGNDHLVTERIVNNLRNGKEVRSSSELQQLADDLSCCYVTLSQTEHLQELESQACIVEIVHRLSLYLQNRWKKQALDHKRDKDKYPGFKDLVDFVSREANDANDPVYGKMGQRNTKSNEKCKSQSSVVKYSTSFSSNARESKVKWKRPPCLVCKGDHKILYCPKFKEMKVNDRIKFVCDHHLCENCLLDNHLTVNCRKASVCDIPGCGRKHTRFIHPPDFALRRGADDNSQHAVCDIMGNNFVNANNVSVDVNVIMPVVHVEVNDSCQTYALLDTGSSNSFCTRSLVDRLGVTRSEVKYVLSTLHKSEEKHSSVVDIKVSSAESGDFMYLSHVLVVDEIPVKSAEINLNSFPYLKDLPLAKSIGTVEVLIGQDHAEALIPLAVRKGGKNEPFAVKTLLGWSLNGPAKVLNGVNSEVISNFICTTSLEDKVESLWKLENEGIMREDSCWSENDKRVINLWAKECKIVDGHFELPVPWKPHVNLSNNFVGALKRLKSLEQSLCKKQLMHRYDQELKLLLEHGYAEAVPPEEMDKAERIWYLPHFAVISDKKPEKVRIVFDCAAKFHGNSLNNNCFQGPDLNNCLLHVLLRFRQHQVAIMGDIEAMYYQVLIPPKDRNALRFLWFDGSGKVCHYRMTRHLFGGIWCSSSSIYALRETVKDEDNVDSLISDTIMKSFYVDDCLRSMISKEEAIFVIHSTCQLLSQFGFRLTKFVSNEFEVLATVPESDRAKEVKDFPASCKSKALGIKWNVVNDSLYFGITVDRHSVTTRRHMLSFLASIFDPLGLVAPVIIAGKLLFQEVTRLKLPWDQEVPGDIELKWKQWLRCFTALGQFEVPRCIKPMMFDGSFLELHHFSDASQVAYGCCTYLRCVHKSGQIYVSLVMSKSKVAPLKQVTIPRLELQAAVMAVRIDSMLCRELDLDLGRSSFWIDSEIVLNYIKNEDKKFHVFVGNRVSEIRQLSAPEQWNHISGKDNPADLVSRYQDSNLLSQGEWLSGPSFLKTFRSEWQRSDIEVLSLDDDPEVKNSSKGSTRTCLASYGSYEPDDPVNRLFEYYSCMFRLKRAVAWLLRLKKLLRKVDLTGDEVVGNLSVHEIAAAEVAIIKWVQQKTFRNEFETLSSGKPVLSSSSVKCLDPFLDGEGLIRVGGRIKGANLDQDAMHPILIPHDHPVATLIVREYHNLAHVGTEWVVSAIRKRFWVTKIRRLIKRVSKSCIICRKYFALPCSQKMSDLPPERLESGNPPFHYVGIDCFGPFLVKSGRSEIKRYGCLFTCMNTRAIHLEKLNSLDLDSFLHGYRRFVCRRGSPTKVWSDNGTNFVGGSAELMRSLKEIDNKQVSVLQNVEWHFNPPSASHMGGLWERLIRTVRKVLAGIAGLNVRLTDESLNTLFCEVEMVVNSRPITKVSDSVYDPSPLTPNHLLLLREQPSLPPGVFHNADLYKRRWRCVQYLADEFWRRWLLEYVPELQKRAKWLHKKENVKVGDLVLIMNECTPRGVWPMGIVQEVYPSVDGLVRSAKVRTKVNELVRPIVKLVLLEGV